MRLVIALLLGTLLVGFVPPSHTSANELTDVQAALSSLVAGWYGDYAVSVTDLQTGARVAVNGNRPQSAASTIKLFILMQVALDIHDGRYAESDVDPLVESMMSLSDNDAARALLVTIGDGSIPDGVGRVNALMTTLGMANSVLNCPPDYSGDCVVADDNYLSTNDLATALTELYTGRALPPVPTSYVLGRLTLPEAWQTAPIAAPLPSDVSVYHKPGWLDDAWNDAAIVVFSDDQGGRHAYVLAFLGSNAPSQTEAANHLTAVSSVVWQEMSLRYSAGASLRFPATGHTISGPFLAYWQSYGLDLGDPGVSERESLALFGYPITDEFTDPQTGLVTQYFERARFELHPGLLGMPYVVELGLLGDSLTAARRWQPAFQPVPGASDDACDFVEATGHRLCNGFRGFWEDNGGWPSSATRSARSSPSAAPTATSTRCSTSSGPASSTTRSSPARRTTSSLACSAGKRPRTRG